MRPWKKNILKTFEIESILIIYRMMQKHHWKKRTIVFFSDVLSSLKLKIITWLFNQITLKLLHDLLIKLLKKLLYDLLMKLQQYKISTVFYAVTLTGVTALTLTNLLRNPIFSRVSASLSSMQPHYRTWSREQRRLKIWRESSSRERRFS